MSAPSIQVAFQGGGAKLLAMLPVAHAFQQCENLGRIKIKALAGTSAGAICAALIAADCDFDRLRTYVRGHAAKHVQNLDNAEFEQLKSLINSKGLAQALWHLVGCRTILKSVYSDGSAVLNETEFGRFLDAILTICKLGSRPIESLPKSLTIIATNLAEARGVERRSGNLKQALRDSCALPVAFRSFRDLTRNHHVDGGLCDNLPVNCLVSDLSTPIFAVFPEETLDSEPISNLPSYLLALFSAAIENNVRRAKTIISESFQISVPCSFSTFGFAEALRLFDDDNWYKRIKDDATERISDFARGYGRLATSNQYRFDDTKNINEYTEALDRMTRDYADHIEFIKTQLIARVNCADRLSGANLSVRRPADGLTKIVRFVVKSPKFRYYSASVVTGPDAPPSIWHAQNRTKNSELPIRVISLERLMGEQKKDKAVLVEFLDPERHISVSDEIELTDTSHRKDAFTDLNAGKRDYVGIGNSHPCSLPRLEILLNYPTSIGKFSLECDFSISNLAPESIGKFEPELEFNDPNFLTVGIRAVNVPPKGRLRCLVVPI